MLIFVTVLLDIVTVLSESIDQFSTIFLSIKPFAAFVKQLEYNVVYGL